MSTDSYLPDQLLIITIASITGLFIVVLSIHLLYHLFFKLQSLNKLMKICCCIFSIAYIPMTITNILTETESEEHRKMYLIVMNACYDVINVALYLIIVLRFYDTFNQTMYQSSTRVYIFIFGLIMTYFLSYTTWFVAYANHLYKDENKSTQIVIIAECILLIVDLILSVTITYLFCKNLFKLTISMSSVSIDAEYDLLPPRIHVDVDVDVEDVEQTKTEEYTHNNEMTEETINTYTATEYDKFNEYDEHNMMNRIYSPQQKSKRSSSILSLSIKTSLMLTASTYYNNKQNNVITPENDDNYHHIDYHHDDRSDFGYSNKANTYVSTLDIKQQQLIKIATRLMILTIPAIVTTTLVWVVSLVTWISLYHNNTNIYLVGRWILHVFVLPIDGIANFLCVYLNFKFSRKLYQWLCCGISRFCENCWAIITELKLDQIRRDRETENS